MAVRNARRDLPGNSSSDSSEKRLVDLSHGLLVLQDCEGILENRGEMAAPVPPIRASEIDESWRTAGRDACSTCSCFLLQCDVLTEPDARLDSRRRIRMLSISSTNACKAVSTVLVIIIEAASVKEHLDFPPQCERWCFLESSSAKPAHHAAL